MEKKKKPHLLCSIAMLLLPMAALFEVTRLLQELRGQTGVVGLVLLRVWRRALRERAGALHLPAPVPEPRRRELHRPGGQLVPEDFRLLLPPPGHQPPEPQLDGGHVGRLQAGQSCLCRGTRLLRAPPGAAPGYFLRHPPGGCQSSVGHGAKNARRDHPRGGGCLHGLPLCSLPQALQDPLVSCEAGEDFHSNCLGTLWWDCKGEALSSRLF